MWIRTKYALTISITPNKPYLLKGQWIKDDHGSSLYTRKINERCAHLGKKGVWEKVITGVPKGTMKERSNDKH